MSSQPENLVQGVNVLPSDNPNQGAELQIIENPPTADLNTPPPEPVQVDIAQPDGEAQPEPELVEPPPEPVQVVIAQPDGDDNAVNEVAEAQPELVEPRPQPVQVVIAQPDGEPVPTVLGEDPLRHELKMDKHNLSCYLGVTIAAAAIAAMVAAAFAGAWRQCEMDMLEICDRE